MAEERFTAWCEGRTGYPLVDAAMAQFNQTGYMHNRLRMVSASFLCKDLGIDWRRGERYFAEQLNDYDLASNNGGWQWASSSGCDAQPWFRIFNPVSQSERFDADGQFILRYLPQLAQLRRPRCMHRGRHGRWTSAAGVELGETILGRWWTTPRRARPRCAAMRSSRKGRPMPLPPPRCLAPCRSGGGHARGVTG